MRKVLSSRLNVLPPAKRGGGKLKFELKTFTHKLRDRKDYKKREFVKMHAKNIIRPLFAAVFILSLFVCLQAQTNKSKQSRWNWKKHQTETINYAKRYLVSNIEPNLPRQSFAEWFRETVGEDAKIDWDINDCGEQTGTSEDRGRDFPMCVKAFAALGSDVSVSVNIQFGTFKRGIMQDKPVVRFISISREDDFGVQPEKLSDLSKRLGELLSK